MSPISRGFRGRRTHVDSARLPRGQHVVDDFPVLSAGSTPHTPLDDWTFQISGAVDQPITWTSNELRALPAETPTVDIHCVTAWSKLDTTWTGVSVDTLLAGLETEAEYVSAWCDDGYMSSCSGRSSARGCRCARATNWPCPSWQSARWCRRAARLDWPSVPGRCARLACPCRTSLAVRWRSSSSRAR